MLSRLHVSLQSRGASSSGGATDKTAARQTVPKTSPFRFETQGRMSTNVTTTYHHHDSFSVEMWDMLFFGLMSGLRKIVVECVGKVQDEQWSEEQKKRTSQHDDTQSVRRYDDGDNEERGGVMLSSRNRMANTGSGAYSLRLPEFATTALLHQRSTTPAAVNLTSSSPSSSLTSRRQREAKLAWELAWRHAKDLDEEAWSAMERRLSKEWISATRLGVHRKASSSERQGAQQLMSSSREVADRSSSSVQMQLVQSLWIRCCSAIHRSKENVITDSEAGDPAHKGTLLEFISVEVADLATTVGLSTSSSSPQGSSQLLVAPAGVVMQMTLSQEFGRFCELVLYRKRQHFPPPLVSELRGILNDSVL
ncbi:Hypothetical protein, putative [Bodo saltans]|uniref:Uncharacterized protein n=1 Tax=Bodo saltans TaxID=75058 RepID=A0A0S4IVU6_BODSA|nr:Hypothetical protein, putative [Bodo saltans]|eukprot:CUG05603.1 Hypothetical protein, putative [Bodo saltans]